MNQSEVLAEMVSPSPFVRASALAELSPERRELLWEQRFERQRRKFDIATYGSSDGQHLIRSADDGP